MIRYNKLILIILLLLNEYSFAKKSVGFQSMPLWESEYEWLSPKKVKITFKTYLLVKSIPSQDSVYYVIIANDNSNVGENFLVLTKDSIIPHLDCIKPINNNYANIRKKKTYETIIDFDNPQLKQSLDNLNACRVRIEVIGNNIFPSDNLSPPTTSTEYYLASIELNRCQTWQAGDKSPQYNSDYIKACIENTRMTQGIHQLDFSIQRPLKDSVDIQLATLTTNNYIDKQVFNKPYSFNYYSYGYCPTLPGGPCNANPKTIPPKGFYLNTKTGIGIFYGKDNGTKDYFPSYVINYRIFKKDSNQNWQLAAITERFNDLWSDSIYKTFKDNAIPYTTNFPYYKKLCEEVADSALFSVTDTAAKLQSSADAFAIDYKSELSNAQIAINFQNSSNANVKVNWTPPLGSALKSPYLLNFYVHETKCYYNRNYLFKSIEYTVLPKPRLTCKIDTTHCGAIKFSVKETQNTGPTQYQWLVYTRTDTVISSTKALDSIAVQKANWYYIKLNASNGYGCSASFLDSVYVHAPAPVVSVNWPKKTLCFNEAFTINTSRKNAYAPAVINWFINHQAAGQADSLIVVGKDSLWIKAILSDNRQCNSADSAWVVAYKPYALKPMKDTALCFKSQLVLTALAANSNDSVYWSCNNGQGQKATIASAAQYHIQYIDSNACSVIDTFTVAQLPALLEPLKDSSLCPGAILNINPIKLSGINYQPCIWQYKQQSIPKDSVSLLINSDQVLTRLVSASIGSSVCSQFDTAHMTTLKSNTICVIALSDSCFNRHKAFVHFENHQPTSPQINWGDMSFALSDSTHHLYQQSGDYKILATFINEQQCPDSSTKALHIAPSPAIAAWLNDSAQCLNNNLFSLNLNCNPNNLQHIDWGDNNTQNSLNGTVQHQYQSDAKSISISSKLLGCTDTVRLPITLYPAPVAQLLSKGQCTQDSIAFWINQSNVRLTQTDWWINTQNIAQDSLTYYVFNQPGNYTIECRIASSNNCYDTLRKALRIVQKPKAAFSFAQKDLGSTGLEYKFINQSQWFNACLWQINKDTSSSIQLSKLFTDTGWMRVVLTVSNQGVCFDSAAQMVPVFRRLKFYFPNACSPNANNLNDGFGLHPEQANWVKQWQLSVFNRWGECLFKSDNPYELFVPNNLPLGIYIYLVELKDILNNTQTYKGSFEVIR